MKLDTDDKPEADRRTFEYRDDFLVYYRAAVEESKGYAAKKLHAKHAADIKGVDLHAQKILESTLAKDIREIDAIATRANDWMDREEKKIATKYDGFYRDKGSDEILRLLHIFCYMMEDSVRFHAGDAHQRMLAKLSAEKIQVTDLLHFAPLTVPANIEKDIHEAFQHHRAKESAQELFRDCTEKAEADLNAKYEHYSQHLIGLAEHYKQAVWGITDLPYQRLVRFSWNHINASIFSPIYGAKVAVNAFPKFVQVEREQMPAVIFKNYSKAISDMNEKGPVALNKIISFSYDVLLWQIRHEAIMEKATPEEKAHQERLRVHARQIALADHEAAQKRVAEKKEAAEARQRALSEHEDAEKRTVAEREAAAERDAAVQREAEAKLAAAAKAAEPEEDEFNFGFSLD